MHLHRGNLFLVGLMGSGKSTLGRILARRFGKSFVDADVELERRLGVTVPVIFEVEGEPGFRERERGLLAELVLGSNVVLATGGGAILDRRNRAALKQNGTVLYLHASPSTLHDRTRRNRGRPLLNTANPLGRLEELYALRDPLYRETADFIVESDREQVSRLAMRLEQQLRSALTNATCAR